MNVISSPARVWIVEDARFDEARRELHVAGRRRSLEAKPLALLHTLLCRAGEVATKDELLRTVWPGVVVTEGSLTTAISKLRAALGPRGRAIIEPVHGVGYRIGVPIELAASTDRARLAFSLQPGETVPNRPQWRLERLLAASGVWLVRHDKTAEPRIFKFADTAERLEELKREAALSRVLYAALGDRPDLVRPIEWNFDTRPWHLESPFGGLDLPAWAAGQGGLANFPLVDRAAIVASVARTVAAAHQVGVLHRDIKPANILLAPGTPPQTRLVDFGAGGLTEAARLHAAAISGLGLTDSLAPGSDRRHGTLRYMAPELLAGGTATMASDVYALGILLYQMAVADLDRPLAAGWEADIEDSLLRADIADAARGNPDRRLPSAALLAERLETLPARAAARRQEEADAMLRAELGRRLERIRLRRPWLVLAAASLLLGLLGTGAAENQAVRNGQQVKREADAARAVNLFLTDDLLSRTNPFENGNAGETLIDATVRAERDIPTRFAAQPLVAAGLYAVLAKAFTQRTAYDAARQAYAAGVASYERAEGPFSADATILRLKWAVSEGAEAAGTRAERAQALIAAARTRIGALGRRRPEAEVWQAYAAGIVAMDRGDARSARALFETAGDRADAMPSVFDPQDRFRFRRTQAQASTRLGDWARAEAENRALLQRAAALQGIHSAEHFLVEMNLAENLIAQDQTAGALPLLDQLDAEADAVLGPTSRLTLIVRANRAEALAQLGRYNDAIRADAADELSAVAQRGATSFEAISIGSDLGLYQCRAGSVADGLQTARSVYAGALAGFGRTAPVTGNAAASLAFCLIEADRPTEAPRLLDTIDGQRVAEVESEPDYPAQLDLMRAAIAIQTGDTRRADALLRSPLRAFNAPKADPYLRSWTNRLANRISVVEAALRKP